MNQTADGQMPASAAVARAGRIRWLILGFVFFATTFNYIDRFTISVLKPTLSQEFQWSESDYADIVFMFQLAYAIGFVFFGRLIDWLGPKLGYTIAVVIWTAAQISCAFAIDKVEFAIVLFALGLGESGNFPAALKTTALWFPQRERSLATGIFNAGSNVGAIITPLLVLYVTVAFGWRAAFVVTGCLSLFWLAAWILFYRNPRDHAWVKPAELAYIESDRQPPVKSLPWLRLFPHKETWAFALGKFLTDPVWWFYLFWLPTIFVEKFGLNLRTFGIPIITVYLISDFGSVFGGWLSSSMIKRGASVNRARKMTMLLCALCVIPVMGMMYVDNVWLAVGIFGLAAAAHQGFSANLFTIPSDTMPKIAVASVVGIGGTAGAVGGLLVSWITGQVRDSIGSYTPLLIGAGIMYLVALLVIHLLSPKLDMAKISKREETVL